MKKGIEKGIEENKNETAIKLLTMKILTVEQISEATVMDITEIENLKSEL